MFFGTAQGTHPENIEGPDHRDLHALHRIDQNPVWIKFFRLSAAEDVLHKASAFSYFILRMTV